ncbi:MAG: hypothetical protein II567_02410, partial [Candidatus Riflebacteria bacterium]|nr:hypothetical protein [Candidatus Riflebacteria bacterium]
MKNIKILNILLLLTSISLMLGCGGGGGGNSYYENENYNADSSAYYDSTKTNVNNLAQPNHRFSAYNGKNSIEIKNIPIDTSKEVLYACLITNPNRLDITDLALIPPLAGNARLSVGNEESKAETSRLAVGNLQHDKPNFVIPFRESLADKARLKEELYNKYLENEANNKKLSLRANISHLNEVEGQRDIDITVLSKSRKCTLAKVSTYAKFFIDQDGDSSVSAPNITNQSLNQFAIEFDNYVYPILKENFGNGSDIFWRDVDNDGKLSIVFSPVVNNWGKSVVGIFDTASINSSNPRDMISIAVKSSNKNSSYEKWFMDARETVPHEMQHIVNFSAKSGRSETTWIDEGLAVCAEILYRKKRSEAGLTSYSLYYGSECPDFPGNDARFYYGAYYMPELSLTEFASSSDDDSINLAHYGQKGLFFYYLYEQYGREHLRQLCQAAERGTEKFNALDRSLGELSIDFNFACLNEKLRGLTFTNYEINPYDV